MMAELMGCHPFDAWAGGCVRKRCPRVVQGPALLLKRNLLFVVDDDPGMLRGVQRLLREHGYDSLSFASADAFQKHDDFDQAICVVLDIDLNGDSGIVVRRRLKAAGISLPVIYITGKDNPATRVAAVQSGCLAYLTKPFAAKSLIESIARASGGLA
jgi:FixJ family two-component response regulator